MNKQAQWLSRVGRPNDAILSVWVPCQQSALSAAFRRCRPAHATVPSALYYARRVAGTPFRYPSPDEDSARWLGFPFRDGDIVISTRSKTGTTWVQMICALLIFQTPELPAPLAQLSPWLDHLIVPREEVYVQLAGQMRWLAGQLGIAVPEQAWPALVQAATFENMRDSADTLVPTAGIFKNNAAFFRRGTSGAGREILSDEELATYHARVTRLAPSDMLTWLHSSHEGL